MAILGPFSKEFNKVMLSAYNPSYCVMKDSGRAGGTVEKIQSCKELGVQPIIIGRDEEEGITDLETIEKMIEVNKSQVCQSKGSEGNSIY